MKNTMVNILSELKALDKVPGREDLPVREQNRLLPLHRIWAETQILVELSPSEEEIKAAQRRAALLPGAAGEAVRDLVRAVKYRVAGDIDLPLGRSISPATVLVAAVTLKTPEGVGRQALDQIKYWSTRGGREGTAKTAAWSAVLGVVPEAEVEQVAPKSLKTFVMDMVDHVQYELKKRRTA